MDSNPKYYFGIWIKSSGIQITVHFYFFGDESGTNLLSISTIGVTLNTTWTELTWESNLDPSVDSFLLKINNVTSDQTLDNPFSFLVDDVRLATDPVASEFSYLSFLFFLLKSPFFVLETLPHRRATR
ncbi:MAG: hypothetical protein ACFFCQ_18715, partial [Promethearchaeota archaeon]